MGTSTFGTNGAFIFSSLACFHSLLILCYFLVVGDVLVVQPPFLFSETIDQEAEEITSNGTEDGVLQAATPTAEAIRVHGPGYLTGVCLVLYAAAAGSLANVVQAFIMKSSGSITNNHLIILGGMSVSALPFYMLYTRCVECVDLHGHHPAGAQQAGHRPAVPEPAGRGAAGGLGAGHAARRLVDCHRRLPAAAPHPRHHAQVAHSVQQFLH